MQISQIFSLQSLHGVEGLVQNLQGPPKISRKHRFIVELHIRQINVFDLLE